MKFLQWPRLLSLLWSSPIEADLVHQRYSSSWIRAARFALIHSRSRTYPGQWPWPARTGTTVNPTNWAKTWSPSSWKCSRRSMAAPELPRRLHSPSSEPFEGKHGSYAFFAPMLFGTFIWSGFKLVHHLVSLIENKLQKRNLCSLFRTCQNSTCSLR